MSKQSATRPRGRPRKAPEESATRQAILAAAVEEFRRHGLRGASVLQICKRAKIANGTFYLHFPDKTRLFNVVMGESLGRLAETLRLANRDSAGLTTIERDRRDLELIVDFYEKNSDFFHIAYDERSMETQGRASLVDLFATQRVADFRRGRRSGLYRGDLHPQLTAYAVTGMINEVLRWWLQHPRALSRKALIDLLLDLCVRMTHAHGDGRG